MTTKRILFEHPDGSVGHIIPGKWYMQTLIDGGMTETEAVDFIRWRDVPANATKVEITDASLLPDRTYRQGWRLV